MPDRSPMAGKAATRMLPALAAALILGVVILIYSLRSGDPEAGAPAPAPAPGPAASDQSSGSPTTPPPTLASQAPADEHAGHDHAGEERAAGGGPPTDLPPYPVETVAPQGPPVDTGEEQPELEIAPPMPLDKKVTRARRMIDSIDLRTTRLEAELAAAEKAGKSEEAQRTRATIERLRQRRRDLEAAVDEGRDPTAPLAIDEPDTD